jgi:hypothetical protein
MFEKKVLNDTANYSCKPTIHIYIVLQDSVSWVSKTNQIQLPTITFSNTVLNYFYNS